MKNLAVIQTAANEIDAALAQDPASGMLNELLVGTYKQELQLYSTGRHRRWRHHEENLR